MPVSRKLKLIFIHIPKTGGTSIEEMFEMQELMSGLVYPSPQHYTGEKVEQIVGQRTYNSFFKFAMVRHPYGRMLSEYHWNFLGINSGKTLQEFVEFSKQVVTRKSYYDFPTGDHFIPQVEFLHKIDLLGRYETFRRSLFTLMFKLGVKKEILHLNQTNSGTQWHLLTDPVKQMIYELYKRDFDELGYEP